MNIQRVGDMNNLSIEICLLKVQHVGAQAFTKGQASCYEELRLNVIFKKKHF